MHSTPLAQGANCSASSSHCGIINSTSFQTTVFDLLQKQTQLISQLLQKQDELTATVTAVHEDLSRTKDHLSTLTQKENEDPKEKNKRAYPSLLTVSLIASS